jgi:hypothetical protein
MTHRQPMPKPRPTPLPPPVASPPPAPVPDSPFLPAALLPITRDTPFRATGDVTLETWTKQFRTAGAPFSDALLEQMWQAAKPVSALVLDRLRIESSYCTAHPLPNTNNCLGLRVPGSLDFAAFYSPVDGIKEVVRRWADPTYRQGIYGPKDLSLAKMLTKYSPPTENDTDSLIASAVTNINQWRGAPVTSPPPPIITPGLILPGLSVPVSFSFPVHVALIPPSQTNQRPGIALSPRDKYIQHETGNLGAGANALMHSRYLDNGAEGQQLSYHFTVDEREAYLKIPLDEVTWHGGDGGSGARCNYTGISCELCVQDNNAHKVQARHNAEELAGKIIAAAKLTMLRSHAWCCTQANAGPGCHYGCPATMFADGYFDQFVANALAWSRK